MFNMEDMVPKDYILRKIDRAIDGNFIYDFVKISIVQIAEG